MATREFSFEPLTAGDLVDRSIRLYRENFFVFFLAAAPPVIIGMPVMLGWWYLARLFFYRGAGELGDAAHYLFLALGNLIIWAVKMISLLVVMGGASRNFIRNIIFDEPLSIAAIYGNAIRRFSALLVSAIVICLFVSFIGGGILYFGLLISLLLAILIAGIFGSVPALALALSVIVGLATAFFTLWLFFLAVSRLAYVPQIVTVEELGPLSAIARSASLSRIKVGRIAALFLFTIVATYSALAILYVPLGWYAWYEGVRIGEVLLADPDVVPVWFAVAQQVISQISLVLLSPVWLIGLCLLYIEDRVRSEGYDLELMATRRLGDIPDVPKDYLNPLRPALGPGMNTDTVSTAPVGRRQSSILGLND
ncbi:MAG: hypothetical protein C4325_08350, partial [Blastocatellia bacterium]